MEHSALGCIETEGMVAAIAALDAAAKAGWIRDVCYEYVIGPEGFVTIKFRGDISDVRAAVEAGQQAASRVTQAYSAQVIPAPHIEVEKVVHTANSFGKENRPPRTIPKELYPPVKGKGKSRR